MYKNKKIVAIIPARAGSKGIQNKNIYLIKGKPLVEYSCEQALASKYIDDVFCSTDGELIASAVKNAGANVIKRPPELSQDTSKTIDAIIHSIEFLKSVGREYDYMVELQPTCPLRTTKQIDEAIKICVDNQISSLVSVHKIKPHPILMRFLENTSNKENGIKLRNVLNTSSTVRRQDMPEIGYVNGAIYIYDTKILTLETSLNDAKYGYEVDPKYCIDIDTIEDIQLVEEILKTRDNKNVNSQ